MTLKKEVWDVLLLTAKTTIGASIPLPFSKGYL